MDEQNVLQKLAKTPAGMRRKYENILYIVRSVFRSETTGMNDFKNLVRSMLKWPGHVERMADKKLAKRSDA